jgi:uncharacterized protein YlxW (UPF0749 family)
VNKEVKYEKQESATVVAHRIICDAVSSHGGISNVPLTKELLTMVEESRTKYRSFLAAAKASREFEEIRGKRKRLQEEVDTLKKRIKSVNQTAEELEKEEDRELRNA